MQDSLYHRNCPRCGVDLSYARKSHYERAVLSASMCRSCSKIGHTVSAEAKQSMSQAKLGHKNPWFGKPGPMAGKTHTSESRLRTSRSLQNHIVSSDTIQKLRTTNSIVCTTPEFRLKMRKIALDRIQLLRGQPVPSYNPTACRYFDQLMEETGVHIQHAENGGEFYVAGLGYWVDGYDAKNNVVYEFDEPHHYRNGELRERDIRRQNEIERDLQCNFVRVKAEDVFI